MKCHVIRSSLCLELSAGISDVNHCPWLGAIFLFEDKLRILCIIKTLSSVSF